MLREYQRDVDIRGMIRSISGEDDRIEAFLDGTRSDRRDDKNRPDRKKKSVRR